MSNKKDIPLVLLKAIEPIAQKNLDLIQVKKEENTYYSFLENDINSKNRFKVFIDGTKVIGKFDTKNIAFEYKPTDETKASSQVVQGTIEDVKIKFESWVQLIREINETPSIYDDNFTNFYSDYYFNQFEIKEENAYIFPFSPDQQSIIEKYLISLREVINSSEIKIDETSKTILVAEIIDISNNLSSSTKNQVMKKITTVFAKLYTISKPITKEIIKEAGKQLIEKLIECGIKYGPKLLDILN